MYIFITLIKLYIFIQYKNIKKQLTDMQKDLDQKVNSLQIISI